MAARERVFEAINSRGLDDWVWQDVMMGIQQELTWMGHCEALKYVDAMTKTCRDMYDDVDSPLWKEVSVECQMRFGYPYYQDIGMARKFIIRCVRVFLQRCVSWGTLSLDAVTWLRICNANGLFRNGIVEVGCGNGFNAMCLQKCGITVFPTDIGCIGNAYTGVEILDGVDAVKKYERCECLMLCWPPNADPLAYTCLKAFKGKYLIYIGEGIHGCTGDISFHEELRNWKCVTEFFGPQYPGLYDSFCFYERE
jgi:hypothetical protein